MSESHQVNVLFCTWGYFPDASGGAEHQAQLQAEELQRRGHAVTVVCPRRGATRSGVINGIKVHRLPFLPLPHCDQATYLVVLLIFLVLQIRRFQVVHIHLSHVQTGVICLAAWLRRRPVYAKISRGGSGGDVEYLYRRWIIRRFVLPYPTFQAISDQIFDDLLAAGVPMNHIVRISNGVDLGSSQLLAATERSELRKRLGLPVEALIVLYVGRFVPVKGLDFLLDAWSRLGQADSVLVLVGRRSSDPQQPESAIDGNTDKGSTRGVIVRDWTEQIADYYAVADIFVLPSRSEGMSNALLEAMASSLPVITTRVGSAASMIEDRTSGCLISPDEPEELLQSLRALMADPELRARLGAAARRDVAASYSIHSVVTRIEAQYGLLLNRKPAVGGSSSG